MIQFTNTVRTLNEYGQKIQNLYRQKNLESGYDPAAELQNISYEVQVNGDQFSIVFNMPDYWKFAENGRRPGKMPPPGVLMKWMEFRHILPTQVQLPNGKTYIPSMQSLEYLIRRKIGREGTQGAHNWEQTENEIRESLISDVGKALQQDFTEYITSNKKTV